MKRSLQRTFSIVIAFVFLVLSGPVASASTFIDNSSDLSQEKLYVHLYEAVCLETCRQDSVFYDLHSTLISFGRPMSTYYYSEGGFSATEAIYIPIFYENALFSIAHMIYSDSLLVGVELSAELVEVLNDHINCEISVVFDSYNTYLSNGTELTLIQSNAAMLENTTATCGITSVSNDVVEAIVDAAADADIDTEKLSAYYDSDEFFRQYNDRALIQQYTMPASTNVHPSSFQLDFTIIQQNGNPICWAAAVAGVGLQQTGISHTAEYVSKYMYGELRGGNTYTALLALQQIYGLNGIDTYYAPYFSRIKTALYDDGYPIYVRVYGTAGEGINHALTVYGYTDFEIHTYDGLLIVGDSNYTAGRVIYFVNDRSYPYTLNGVTGYIDQFILLY